MKENQKQSKMEERNNKTWPSINAHLSPGVERVSGYVFLVLGFFNNSYWTLHVN